MISFFKSFFKLIVLASMVFLVACNSDESSSESKGLPEESVVLSRIVVTPSSKVTLGVSTLKLAAGNKQPFEAIGYYSDGSAQTLEDLTLSDWHTDDNYIAFFEEPGVLVASQKHGLVTVYVTKNGVSSNTVTVDVTAAVITNIRVTLSSISISKGQTEQLTAIATYSDNTSSDVTRSVEWMSTNTSIATVTSGGLLSGLNEGNTSLFATKDGITSNTVKVVVTEATLTALQVTPSPITVAKGQSEQLTVTATYSDNTSSDVTNSVTWVSTDPDIALVTSSGLLSGSGEGHTSVIATKDGINSNNVKVVVTEATIIGLQVTPSAVTLAKGQSEELTVIATYSDNTSSDVTNSVAWVSTDPEIALVTSSGLLSGSGEGHTSVIAMKDGISSNNVNVVVTEAIIMALQVTPSAVTLAKGQSEQLTVVATYSDNTSSDVTNSVTWLSADAETALVTSSGLLSGSVEGHTSVIAMKDGISSNNVNVVVTEATIMALQVTPSAVTLAKGQSEQLTVVATYSDNTSSDVTNSVTWLSLDSGIALATSTGLLSGADEGITSLIVMKDGISSNTVEIIVTPAIITAIHITPITTRMAKGQTEQLKATATYSDNSDSDITTSVSWISSDTRVATITSTGILSAVDVGNVILSATKNGVNSDPVNADVTPAIITEIIIDPAVVTIAKGQIEQLSASAVYSDNNLVDVTNSVSWFSTDTEIATVTTLGVLNGIDSGFTKVTATKDGIKSNALDVTICYSFAEACIDVFDSGSGKLYTNSPSVEFLDKLNAGAIAQNIYTEHEPRGPEGDFYILTLSSAYELCELYNNHALGGRTNWRLPELDELQYDIYQAFDNMFVHRSWPTEYYYWSNTPYNTTDNFYINLNSGASWPNKANVAAYVSCVSSNLQTLRL